MPIHRFHRSGERGKFNKKKKEKIYISATLGIPAFTGAADKTSKELARFFRRPKVDACAPTRFGTATTRLILLYRARYGCRARYRTRYGANHGH